VIFCTIQPQLLLLAPLLPRRAKFALLIIKGLHMSSTTRRAMASESLSAVARQLLVRFAALDLQVTSKPSTA
jgi:hypothetical protein